MYPVCNPLVIEDKNSLAKKNTTAYPFIASGKGQDENPDEDYDTFGNDNAGVHPGIPVALFL